MIELDIKKGFVGVVVDMIVILKVNFEMNSLLYCGYFV